MTDQGPTVQLVDTPDELGPRLLTAINAGDVAAIVALYTEDAVLELPDGSVARGGSRSVGSTPPWWPSDPSSHPASPPRRSCWVISP